MNPIVVAAPDGLPLVELKQGLVLYMRHPIARETAGMVLDTYLHYCGSHVRRFRSTAPGAPVCEWRSDSINHFRSNFLPDLYRRIDWGWMLSDGMDRDSWMFMFHAYRPAQEPGKASILRFDFPWNVDSDLIRRIAADIISSCSFISGFGGYFLQGRGDLRWLPASFDKIYALSSRYWGAEAHNPDVTVDFIGDGFKCVNWLTLIGKDAIARDESALVTAKRVAMGFIESSTGIILQATPAPLLGDRNRGDDVIEYRPLAIALERLQIREHGAFGGNLWTDENALDYLRRFTQYA